MIACNRQSTASLRGLTAAIAISLLAALPGSAPAVDTGAVGNGDWSSAATWTNGVPGASDNAYIGGGYPTGAATTATVGLSQNSSARQVYLGYPFNALGTLDLGGFTLTAGNLFLGYPSGTGSIVRTGGGSLSINTMFQYSGSFLFDKADSAATLYIGNSSAATTAVVSNVTDNVLIDVGSKLTLGANLSLSDNGSGSRLVVSGTLDFAGHAVSAPTVYLGSGQGPFCLTNRGPITTSSLYVSSLYSPGPVTFSPTASDGIGDMALEGVNTVLPALASVQSLALYSNGSTPPTYSSLTTSAVGNVSGNIYVDPGNNVLTLEADLNLSQDLVVNGGTLNANGYAISAQSVQFASADIGGPVVVQNDGPVTTNRWLQGNGEKIRLNHAGDALGTLLLKQDSSLELGDAAGQTTGLTATRLSIDSTSDLILDVNGFASGWVFRWADPNTADLQALINAGEVTFSYSNGGSYTITSDGSYTYVNVIPVPEPSTLLLSTTAAGLLAVRRSPRRQRPTRPTHPRAP